ncbi:hypothetical protein [Lutispora saccharofermentans]|uniref:Uncharacterized protein n=1 Tax=Lutispora saccharofermentans TaxID=3024236 RepID=A0ABT1NHP8_9FIRM|nr:hypothetical protein [Lutispora saccharofermentans]MCQ1530737.1 hypothetical protein [Lutispora saccharofermentans]
MSTTVYTHESRKDPDYDSIQDYQKEPCENVKGNAIDVELRPNDCEVRADIVVDRERCIRLWGQIKDCEGKPVKDALVKLLKPIWKYGKIEYVGVAHTTTDCLGFYQFNICPDENNNKFRVIVSKAAKGNERVIYTGGGKCNPCADRQEKPEEPCGC